jgi:hypothetical protein
MRSGLGGLSCGESCWDSMGELLLRIHGIVLVVIGEIRIAQRHVNVPMPHQRFHPGGKSTPASTRQLAKACRRSWNMKSAIPASGQPAYSNSLRHFGQDLIQQDTLTFPILDKVRPQGNSPRATKETSYEPRRQDGHSGSDYTVFIYL